MTYPAGEVRQTQNSSRSSYIRLLPRRGALQDLPSEETTFSNRDNIDNTDSMSYLFSVEAKSCPVLRTTRSTGTNDSKKYTTSKALDVRSEDEIDDFLNCECLRSITQTEARRPLMAPDAIVLHFLVLLLRASPWCT